MDLSMLEFARPQWFFALLPLLLLTLWLARNSREKSNWQAICDPALLPHVLQQPHGQKKRSLAAWVLALGSVLVVALAGPSWQNTELPALKGQSALVIALDLTASMQAQDVKPSRLQRAKFKIEDLLKQRKDGQTALLVYAGDAFAVSPLTDDTNTILAQLPALTPDIMPVQGNHPTNALTLATELLQQANKPNGDILLLTDDVNGVQAQSAFEQARQAGYNVSVMSVGSEQGAPIPSGRSVIKDAQGQVVLAEVNIQAMQQAAQSGGGVYVPMSNNDSDIAQLQQWFSRHNSLDKASAADLQIDTRQQEGAKFVLLALPLMLLMFRRKAFQGLALVCLMPFAMPSQAFEWQDAWQTPNQQAAKLIEQGNPTEAAKHFEDLRWKQVAQYQAKDYQAALQAEQTLSTSADWYNQGNVLARLGELDKAINAYSQALELDADNLDADYNRTLLQQLKEQQEQKEQQKQQGSDSGEDQQQDSGAGEQQQGSGGEDQQQDSGASEQQQESGGEGQQQDSGAGEQQQESGGEDQQQDSGASEQQQGSGGEDQQAGHDPNADALQQALNDAQSQAQIQALQQPEEGEPQQEQMAALDQMGTPDEQSEATKQWLRKVKDDQALLWKRKFLYQYKQRQVEPTQTGGKQW